MLALLGSTQSLLYYDLPLFILFFGLIFIVTRFVIRVQDPAVSAGASAFSAALAYFIVRSQEPLYSWFFQNFQSLVSIVVLLLIVFIMIYVIVKIL